MMCVSVCSDLTELRKKMMFGENCGNRGKAPSLIASVRLCHFRLLPRWCDQMELNDLSAAPLCKAATNITADCITARQRNVERFRFL